MSVKVASPGIKTIDLLGLSGTFYVEGARTKVHYCSTYANPSKNAKGGHYDLLEHLAPMRERVASAQLSNLDSLLQRDLSDERIASELVPYLKGKLSNVGFFPPIVAVLLPEGFIATAPKKAIKYPEPKRSKKDLEADYGGCWRFTSFPEGDGSNAPTRLGQLSINPKKTDIIVLDGQHRANAFRYVAGCFDPGDAYTPFYDRVTPLAEYGSDLPVTIIWFEADKKGAVKPTDVSRELFVAVNNNARRVSESRSILLDDVAIERLAVNTYYRYLAENRGFATGAPSLLTACFDMDSELADSRQPAMALTSPVLLASALNYAFWGNPIYDKLREKATRASQSHLPRFKRIFGHAKYIPRGEDFLRIVDDVQRVKFRKDFGVKYLPVLEMMLTAPALAGVHYEAVGALAEDLANPAKYAPEYGTWWKKAFIGGEGLYGAYMASEMPSCQKVKGYLGQINNRFREARAVAYLKAEGVAADKKTLADEKGSVDQVYESFNTVAFQTGFLMAVDYLIRNEYGDNWAGGMKKIRKAVESITLEQWRIMFGPYRELYVGGVDPNSWPKFRKMLLSVMGFQGYFDEGEQVAPELVMVSEGVTAAIQGEVENKGSVTKGAAKKIVEKVVDDVRAVFRTLDVGTVSAAKLEKWAKAAANAALEETV